MNAGALLTVAQHHDGKHPMTASGEQPPTDEPSDPTAKRASRQGTSPHGSDLRGLTGLFERLLRRYKGLVHILTLAPMYLAGSLILGLAVTPSVAIANQMWRLVASTNVLIKYPVMGATLAACFFTYGFTLILIVPVCNRIFVGKLKPWRGPYYSAATARWYIHNGLTYLVRYTFLEFITPTPFNNFFFRQMGMKIGRGAQINTANISDPSLIELGDRVTIGGSATVVGHYGQGGYLVLAPVRIGDGATIGLRATIMGDVTVGEQSRILPNSVVLPKTKIPAGETWGGVPATKIERRSSGNRPETTEDERDS
mgnify:CR=1 FL=1